MSAEKDPAQQSILYDNRTLGAGFLAAVTADTAAVFVCGRFAPVAGVPVNGFGANGTHLDTCAAIGAL